MPTRRYAYRQRVCVPGDLTPSNAAVNDQGNAYRYEFADRSVTAQVAISDDFNKAAIDFILDGASIAQMEIRSIYADHDRGKIHEIGEDAFIAQKQTKIAARFTLPTSNSCRSLLRVDELWSIRAASLTASPIVPIT